MRRAFSGKRAKLTPFTLQRERPAQPQSDIHARHNISRAYTTRSRGSERATPSGHARAYNLRLREREFGAQLQGQPRVRRTTLAASGGERAQDSCAAAPTRAHIARGELVLHIHTRAACGGPFPYALVRVVWCIFKVMPRRSMCRGEFRRNFFFDRGEVLCLRASWLRGVLTVSRVWPN